MKSARPAVLIPLAALLCLVGSAAHAQIVYAHMGDEDTGYNCIDELYRNGNIEIFADFLCLTPAQAFQHGSVWHGEKQAVGPGFGTIFQVQISDVGNYFKEEELEGLGGDGFAFVIQNATTNALGGTGGNIGYHGIPNSLAIEFDTWDNNLSGHEYVEDPNGNHLAVQTRGTNTNSELHEHAIALTTNIPVLTDGEIHTVIVEYEPGLLAIYIDDIEEPVLAVEVDLEELLELDDGYAWVGFTASTGMAYENHDILNWAYTGAEWNPDSMRFALKSGAYPPADPGAIMRMARFAMGP